MAQTTQIKDQSIDDGDSNLSSENVGIAASKMGDQIKQFNRQYLKLKEEQRENWFT